MKVDDLAALLGMTRSEVESMLKQQEVVDLRLTERDRQENFK
ncbi:MAG: hypothetical protein V1735_05370 [Nanoarchaeota archaeon]